jgi:hypothetical protein
MANYVRQVRHYDNLNGAGRIHTTEVRAHSDVDGEVSGATQAERVVSLIVGIVEVLLAARLILALLGANPSNGLVNLVYSITKPLIAPFVGIFGSPTLGISNFETATLVAMVVYALIGWGINAAIRLNRKDNGEVEL